MLLREYLSPVVGALCFGDAGGQVWLGPAATRVGGWLESRAPGEPHGERVAHNGV